MLEEIVFSRHALRQMQEKNIAPAEIIDALHFPDKIRQQTSLKLRAVKTIKRNKKRYLLIAIYRQNRARKIIITAFLTSKVKKYLTA